MFKMFQKQILLGDSERGFEPWSPRSPSCNLITSYFGESTSSSAAAIPLCTKRVRDPAWRAGGHPLVIQERQQSRPEPQHSGRSFYNGVICCLTEEPLSFSLLPPTQRVVRKISNE